MIDKIIASGFGGQGVITLGKLIAYIGMKKGKHVTHFPSYGAEMRGGTANCSVIVSDDEVASPVFTHPTTTIVMNTPSLVKFAPMADKDSYFIIDSSRVTGEIKRQDLKIISVPASQIANDIGNVKIANIFLLGIYGQIHSFFTMEEGKQYLEEFFKGKKEELIHLNIKALDQGFRYKL